MINRGITLNGVYYVYILKCIDKKGKTSYYTGSTQDLVKRFDQHRTGQGARYTAGRDLDLVFFESYSNRSLAMKREYEIKNLSGPKKMQLIVNFQNTIGKKAEA
jgi:putative endonuclease